MTVVNAFAIALPESSCRTEANGSDSAYVGRDALQSLGDGGQLPTRLGSRHTRSKGSRQARGATS